MMNCENHQKIFTIGENSPNEDHGSSCTEAEMRQTRSCSTSRSTSVSKRNFKSKIPISKQRLTPSSSRSNIALEKRKLRKEIGQRISSSKIKLGRHFKSSFNSDSSDSDRIRPFSARNSKAIPFSKSDRINNAHKVSGKICGTIKKRSSTVTESELSETSDTYFEKNDLRTSVIKEECPGRELCDENTQTKDLNIFPQMFQIYSSKSTRPLSLAKSNTLVVTENKEEGGKESQIDLRLQVNKRSISDLFDTICNQQALREKELELATPEYLHNSVNKLNYTIKVLLTEKNNLEQTVNNFQSKILKLEKDIEESQRISKEYKDRYENELKEKEMIKEDFTQTKGSFMGIETATSKLCEVNKDITAMYENLLLEYENSKKQSEVVITELMAKIEFLNFTSEENKKATDQLEMILQLKEKDITKLLQQKEELTSKVGILNSVKANAFHPTRSCQTDDKEKIAFSALQKELSKVREEHHKGKEEISKLTLQLHDLQKRLEKTKLEKINELRIYKSHMEMAIKHFEEEKKIMKIELENLRKEDEVMNVKFETERKAHEQLSLVHKELAEKLLRAVKLLIDEKLARQAADMRIVEFSQQILTLESDKKLMEQKLDSILTENTNLNGKIGDLNQDKKSLQEIINDLQLSLKTAENRSARLENQVKKLKLKNKEKSKTFIIENFEKRINSLGLTKDSLIESLKDNVGKCQNLILEYKQQVAGLEKKITKLEFQRCENSIRFHEVTWKLNKEQLLNEKLQQVTQRILAEVKKMKNDGSLPKSQVDSLLSLIHAEFERFHGPDVFEEANAVVIASSANK